MTVIDGPQSYKFYFLPFFLAVSAAIVTSTQPLTTARDFVWYFSICAISISFFFSFFCVFFCPLFFCYVSSFCACHLFPQLCLPTSDFFSVQTPMVLEPAALSTPPREPITALLPKHLACQNAEFAKLDKAFLAREDRVLVLEWSLAMSPSNQANPRSQVSTLQTDLDAVHADPTASQSSVPTATSKLDRLVPATNL